MPNITLPNITLHVSVSFKYIGLEYMTDWYQTGLYYAYLWPETFIVISIGWRTKSLHRKWLVDHFYISIEKHAYSGVSKNKGTPKWMVYNENPIKIDDLEVPPFSETSIWSSRYVYLKRTPSFLSWITTIWLFPKWWWVKPQQTHGVFLLTNDQSVWGCEMGGGTVFPPF